MTTSQLESSEPTTGASPVFVDDSGRRRSRVRLLGGLAGGFVALYLVLVLVGLIGSSSLPVVHIGDVARLPPRERGALEKRSKSVALTAPSELADLPQAALNAAAVRAAAPGSGSGSASIAYGGSGAPAPADLPPTAGGVVPTTTPTVVTTVPSAPSTVHGPPTSLPGKGHRR